MRFRNVNEFAEKTGRKKGHIAESWGISRFQMSALIYPGRYRFALTDEQWARIARDLGMSADRLKQQYGVHRRER